MVGDVPTVVVPECKGVKWVVNSITSVLLLMAKKRLTADNNLMAKIHPARLALALEDFLTHLFGDRIVKMPKTNTNPNT